MISRIPTNRRFEHTGRIPDDDIAGIHVTQNDRTHSNQGARADS
jgi:hypothetical protein